MYNSFLGIVSVIFKINLFFLILQHAASRQQKWKSAQSWHKVDTNRHADGIQWAWWNAIPFHFIAIVWKRCSTFTHIHFLFNLCPLSFLCAFLYLDKEYSVSFGPTVSCTPFNCFPCISVFISVSVFLCQTIIVYLVQPTTLLCYMTIYIGMTKGSKLLLCNVQCWMYNVHWLASKTKCCKENSENLWTFKRSKECWMVGDACFKRRKRMTRTTHQMNEQTKRALNTKSNKSVKM